MPSEFSDLIAVEKHHHEEQQVDNEGAVSSQRTHDEEGAPEFPAAEVQAAPKGRILSLKSSTFRIVAITILVIIIVAIGGGVGGALSQKDNNDTASQASATTRSSTASNRPSGPISSPPTKTPPSPTTTEVVGPTTTLLRDCPSSNYTIYTAAYGGKPRLFRKICNVAIMNSARDEWIVNVRTTTLDDCIDQCAAYNAQEKDAIKTGDSIVCNAVCWQNTFDTDWPGQCFGYATQNSTDEGLVLSTDDWTCDSAAWINQSFD